MDVKYIWKWAGVVLTGFVSSGQGCAEGSREGWAERTVRQRIPKEIARSRGGALPAMTQACLLVSSPTLRIPGGGV